MNQNHFKTLDALIKRLTDSKLPATEKEGYLALLSHIKEIGYALTENDEELDGLMQNYKAATDRLADAVRDVEITKVEEMKAHKNYTALLDAKSGQFQRQGLKPRAASGEAHNDPEVTALFEILFKAQEAIGDAKRQAKIAEAEVDLCNKRYYAARDKLQGKIQSATGG